MRVRSWLASIVKANQIQPSRAKRRLFQQRVSTPPSYEPLEDRRMLAVTLTDWMADLPDSIRLSEISIPGTHDTLTYGYPLQHIATDTQDMNLVEQANAGIRFWDIRLKKVNVGLGFPVRFHGHHGDTYVSVNFDQVLKDAVSFLTAHPEETILMRINTKESGGFGFPLPSDIELLNEYLDGSHEDMNGLDSRSFLYRKPHPTTNANPNASLFIGSSGPASSIATLEEVRGKMVWFMDNWGDEDPTLYKFSDVTNSTDFGTYSNGTDVWNQTRSYLDEVQFGSADSFYRIGMTGQSFPSAPPWLVAQQVNPIAQNYFSVNRDYRTIGIITMDFPETEGATPDLITNIIEQNGLAHTQMFVNAGGDAIPNDPFVDDGYFRSWKSDASVSIPTHARHNLVANTSSSAATIDVSDPSVPTGTPLELFQSERWDPANGAEMQWNFPVVPGDYQVRLYFAENTLTAAGLREFDVFIEGNQVLDDYDVFFEAGGIHKAIAETFTVSSDDNLDIDFGHVVENPLIQGIEFRRLLPNVYRANAGGLELTGSPDWESDKALAARMNGFNSETEVATILNGLEDTNENVPSDHGSRSTLTPNVVLLWGGGDWEQWRESCNPVCNTWPNDLGGGVYQMDGNDLFTIEFTPDPGWNVAIDSFDLNKWGGTDNINVNWSVFGAQSGLLRSGTTNIPKDEVVKPVNPIRVTGTGSEKLTLYITNSFGNELAIDNLKFKQVRNPVYAHSSVPSGTPMNLFRSSRDDVPGLENLHFDFAVKPGDYEVQLYFIDVNPVSPVFSGNRVFDVIIEGITVQNDYEIKGDVGTNVGVVKSYFITSDDNLDIDLDTETWISLFGIAFGGATISGIEIVQLLPATVSIATPFLPVNEGNAGTTSFPFSILRNDGNPNSTVTVDYYVTGSGVNPADAADFAGGVYPTGSVTFNPNETSKLINIPVNGDTTFEPDEGFTVILVNPVGAAIAVVGGSAIATIDNDDALLPTTEVTLNAGILTITDIAGGDSNDDLTLSYAAGNYTISDSFLKLTTSIGGANGSGTNVLVIPETSVTGITFDTLGGNDTITVNGVQAGLGNFTINGSVGHDNVHLNSDISFASDANLNVDLTVGASVGDLDRISLGSGANLELLGSGAATLKASRDIIVNSGASITTTDGNLTLDANIGLWTYESPDVPLNILDQQTILSSLLITDPGTVSDVNVTLDIAHSYHADLDVVLVGPDGTRVELFSDVGGAEDNFFDTTLDDEGTLDISLGSGTFTGVFRPGGSLSDFDGKSVAGLWQLEITDDAASDIGTLNSWSLNFADAQAIQGILVDDATLETNGIGNIILSGQGGNDPAGNQRGVNVKSGGIIRATSSGNVTIVGTGGRSLGNSNFGVSLTDAGTSVGSLNGTVDIRGQGGGAGTSTGGIGILIAGGVLVQSSGLGNVFIDGTGGFGNGGFNAGIEMRDTATQVLAASGNIHLTGAAGEEDSSGPIRVFSSVTIASANGDILVAADDAYINSSTVNAPLGIVTIIPITNGIEIGLGGNSVGKLALTDAELDQITAGTINIGDGNSGAITFSANIDRSSNTNINLTSGANNDIAFGNYSLNAGAGGNVTLTTSGTGAITTADTVDTDLTSGNLTLLTDAGVGSLANPLRTQVINLEAVSGGGGVFVSNIGDLTIGGIGATVGVSANNADINISAASSITVSENVSPGTGSVSLSATETISLNSGVSVSATGGGTIDLTAEKSISLVSGSSISTVDGNLTLKANQQVTPTPGNFAGVNVVGGIIQSTGTGQVMVEGRGGNDLISQTGVSLSNAQVMGGTAGVLTVIGTGGAGSNQIHRGVSLGGTSIIGSSGADVVVSGQGGGTGTSSFNIGVSVFVGSTISAGGTGDVTVVGTGGVGSGGSNWGIEVNSGSISSTDGNVIITGQGGSMGGDSRGVTLLGIGSITANGSGKNIQVTGTAGAGAGIPLHVANTATITAAMGDITLIADDMVFSDTPMVSATEPGRTVTLKPQTISREIDLGSNTSGKLGLTDTELDLITAARIVIGSSTSGDVAFTSAIAMANSDVLEVVTGGTINDTGSLTIFTDDSLGLTSVAGVGTTSPLNISVSNVEATTVTGGINVTNGGALNIGGVSSSLFGVRVTGATGEISLVNNGSVLINTNGENVQGPQNITIDANGGTSDVQTGASQSAIHSMDAGLVSLSAGRDIKLGSTMGYGDVYSNNGSLTFVAGRDLVIDSNTYVQINVAGSSANLSVAAGRDILLGHALGSDSRLQNQGSGNLTLTTGPGGLLQVDFDSTFAITTAGGGLTFNADRLDLTAGDFISAGTGQVIVAPATVGRLIDLGSATDLAANTLELSEAELARITAVTINVGNSNSGDITISSLVSPTPTAELNLHTGGRIIPLTNGVDVSIGAATLGFGSELSIAVNGTNFDTQYQQLNVEGQVNLTGLDLTFNGTHVPSAGEQFIIVNNDGTDSISGTFNGLPEGTMIGDFLGSGLDATISYLGVDASTGNDAVLTVGADIKGLHIFYENSAWDDPDGTWIR